MSKAVDIFSGILFVRTRHYDDVKKVVVLQGNKPERRFFEERPQGEWMAVEPTEEDKEYGFDIRIVCSRCYEPDSHYDYDKYHKPKAVWYFRPNFCPNCGAKMKGGTE